MKGKKHFRPLPKAAIMNVRVLVCYKMPFQYLVSESQSYLKIIERILGNFTKIHQF